MRRRNRGRGITRKAVTKGKSRTNTGSSPPTPGDFTAPAERTATPQPPARPDGNTPVQTSDEPQGRDPGQPEPPYAYTPESWSTIMLRINTSSSYIRVTSSGRPENVRSAGFTQVNFAPAFRGESDIPEAPIRFANGLARFAGSRLNQA